MIRIDNPAQTYERVYERLQTAIRLLTEDERANRYPSLFAMQRRRIAALRATLTRVTRMMSDD